MITEAQLHKSIDYTAYLQLIKKSLTLGFTTGHEQSEKKISYTRLNLQRMQRVEKQTVLSASLRALLHSQKQKVIWLVITEAWCGDAAHNLPALKVMAEASSAITFRVLLRDDNPDVMEQYLTNGARSIPKLICFSNDRQEEFFTWGPRPAPLQKQVQELISNKAPLEQKNLFLQKWYNNDQSATLQEEIEQLVKFYIKT